MTNQLQSESQLYLLSYICVCFFSAVYWDLLDVQYLLGVILLMSGYLLWSLACDAHNPGQKNMQPQVHQMSPCVPTTVAPVTEQDKLKRSQPTKSSDLSITLSLSGSSVDIPPNALEPIPFETDLFRGHVLILLRPKDENKDEDDHHHPYAALFHQKKRRVWLQVQGEFLRPPQGLVYMGAEVPGFPPTTFVSRAIIRFIVGIISKIMRHVHFSLGRRRDAEGEMEEFPHCTFPLYQCADQLVETMEGEVPPTLGSIDFGELKDARERRMKSTPRVDQFATHRTYSFHFHSAFVDFPTWSIVNVFGVRNHTCLTSMLKSCALHFVAYELMSSCPKKEHHALSSKQDLFRFQLSHVKCQPLPPPKQTPKMSSHWRWTTTNTLARPPSVKNNKNLKPAVQVPLWMEKTVQGKRRVHYLFLHEDTQKLDIRSASRVQEYLIQTQTPKMFLTCITSRRTQRSRIELERQALDRWTKDQPQAVIDAMLRETDPPVALLDSLVPDLLVNNNHNEAKRTLVVRYLNLETLREETLVMEGQSMVFYRGDSRAKVLHVRDLVSIQRLSSMSGSAGGWQHQHRSVVGLEFETVLEVVRVVFMNKDLAEHWAQALACDPNRVQSLPLCLFEFPPETKKKGTYPWSSEDPSWMMVRTKNDKWLGGTRLCLKANDDITKDPCTHAQTCLRQILQCFKPEATVRDYLVFLDLVQALTCQSLEPLLAAKEAARKPKLVSFFLNIYHTMILHALVCGQTPTSERKGPWGTFMSRWKYCLDGMVFSLADIAFVILRRCPAKLPSQALVHRRDMRAVSFSRHDRRFQFQLQSPANGSDDDDDHDHRILWALNSTRSWCPESIVVYHALSLDAQLDTAVSVALMSSRYPVTVDLATRTIYLPKRVAWLRVEIMGGRRDATTRVDLARALLPFVPSSSLLHRQMAYVLDHPGFIRVKYRSYESGIHTRVTELVQY